MDILKRLAEQNITLPTPAPAAGNYLPYILEGNFLFISGQLPFDETGALAYTGLIGDRSLEEGQKAARLCCINILAQASHALEGDLSRIKRCMKLGGYVASTRCFIDQPQVINGASDLIVDILGETGKHSRIAVGVPCLPLDASVEIEAQFYIENP